MDKKQFAEIMTLLCEIYNRQPSKSLLAAYYMGLNDLTIEQFKEAVSNLIKTRTYQSLPKPAEIREQITANLEDIALMAWKSLKDAMESVGAYQSPDFEDYIIPACVDSLGGWSKLCRTESDELKWVQKDFERLYRAFAKNGHQEVRLIGLGEKDQVAQNAEEIEKPIIIGCSYQKPEPKKLTGGRAIEGLNIKRISK